MQHRQAARRSAPVHLSSAPDSPVYSSKRLLGRLSLQPPAQIEDNSSDSSSSPDSLYSHNASTLPDTNFEYDNGEEEVRQYDEADYESLMAESEGWATPAHAAWPEVTGGGLDFTPNPSNYSPNGGTIISISPVGSWNSRRSGRASSSVSRSGGTEKSSGGRMRRGSDASLLGYELNSPSRESLPGSLRRRSSGLSEASIGSVEEAQLRTVYSMGMLRRRFSEVVEVVGTPDSARQDPFIARRLMSQWSPSTSGASDTTDASEIHTAYTPTPIMQSSVPVIISNYPLTSIAAPPQYNDTPTETPQISLNTPPRSPAPTIPLPQPPRTFATPPSRIFATTPPPDQPAKLLRHRVKPIRSRASTGYQLLPRVDVVPEGTTAPPLLRRSTFTPFFAASRGSDLVLASRVPVIQGVVPVQRASPVGVSPLRSSLQIDSPRISQRDPHQPSLSSQMSHRRVSHSRNRSGDLRRVTMDRRLSFEVHRMSEEGAKMSADGDKMSMAGGQMSLDGRQMSSDGRQMSMDGRQMSIDGRQLSGNGLRMSSSGDQMSIDSRVTLGDGHQMSLDGRQMSGDGRQMSMDGRQMSGDGLKMSNNGDQMSVDGRQMSGDGRQMSVDGNKMSADGVRMSNESRSLASFMKDGRRPSAASIKHMSQARRVDPVPARANSNVSITEYAYLAPRIVLSSAPESSPPSVLPDFNFAFTPTFTEDTASGFSNIDSDTPRLTPRSDFSFPAPARPSICPLPIVSGPVHDDAATPRPCHGIMDRGRPLSPPEFTENYVSRQRRLSFPSPTFVQPDFTPKVSQPDFTPRVIPSIELTRAVSPPEPPRSLRKAVPQMSEEQMISEERKERHERRKSMRAAVGQVESASALVRELAQILQVEVSFPNSPDQSERTPRPDAYTHRRGAVSADTSSIRPSTAPSHHRQPGSAPTARHRRAISTDFASRPVARPRFRRQITNPDVLDITTIVSTETSRAEKRKSHMVFEASRWGPPAHLPPSQPMPLPRAHPRVQSSYTPAQSFAPYVPYAFPAPRASAAGQFRNPTQYHSQPLYPSTRPPSRGTAHSRSPTFPQPLDQSAPRRSSVTFAEEPIYPPSDIHPSNATVSSNTSRAKSFTRFFRSRPHTPSGSAPAPTPPKARRGSMKRMNSDLTSMGLNSYEE